MRVEIEFRPGNGKVNLLYATFTTEQLKELREISGYNAEPDDAIVIRAAEKPGGPERGMVLRCWRIRDIRVLD